MPAIIARAEGASEPADVVVCQRRGIAEIARAIGIVATSGAVARLAHAGIEAEATEFHRIP